MRGRGEREAALGEYPIKLLLSIFLFSVVFKLTVPPGRDKAATFGSVPGA